MASPAHGIISDATTTTPAAVSSPYLHPLQIHKVRETHKALVGLDLVTGRKIINQYEVIEEIGRGIHGKLKLARNLENGENVAIKIVARFSKMRRLGKLTPLSPQDKTMKEIAILKKIRHPNVVALLEIIDDPELKKIYIVLEHVELGEVVWRKKGLPWVCAFERRRVEREMRGEISTEEEEEQYIHLVERRSAINELKRAKIQQNHKRPEAFWSIEDGASDDEDDAASLPNSLARNNSGFFQNSDMPYLASRKGSRATSRVPSRVPSMEALSQAVTSLPSESEISSVNTENLSNMETPGPFPSQPGSSTALDTAVFSHEFRAKSPSITDSIISHMSSVDFDAQPHDPYADDYSYVPCFSIEDARAAFRDTVLGLEYLHSKGIVHRDIKPANLFWTKDHQVKISDFGVSYLGRPIRDGEVDEFVLESEARDFDDDLELAKTVGTPAFFAPELCYTGIEEDEIKISEQIDVWSLGVTLYCLIYARIPFMAEDEFQMFRKIAKDEVHIPRRRLKPVNPDTNPASTSLHKRVGNALYRDDNEILYEEVDDLLYDLLRRILTKNPEKRIRLREVKRHPWVLQGIPDIIAWIEDTDPSRRTSGQGNYTEAEQIHRQAASSAGQIDKSGALDDDDSDGSFTDPSYAESVLSKAGSWISVTSNSSSQHLQSAREEIVEFFLSDIELEPLFAAAIKDRLIGGDRLERNFKRLLVAYSKELLARADIKLYHETAKLIRNNATFVSRAIRHRYEPPQQDSGITFGLDKSDQDERTGRRQVLNNYIEEVQKNYGISHSESSKSQMAVDRAPLGSDTHSDSDGLESTTSESEQDKTIFLAALGQVKEFLQTGPPLDNLRLALKKFVLPRAVQAAEFEHPNNNPFSKLDNIEIAENFPGSLPGLLDYLLEFLPFPWFEPPVPPGHSRVRWKCICGTKLFDDFIELESGSLKELEVALRTANNPANSQRQYSFSRTIWNKFTSVLSHVPQGIHGSAASGNGSLPLHNTQQSQATTTNIQQPGIQHVLCCMHSGETGTRLHQQRLPDMATDRELILFLKKVYHSQRSALSWLTLRHVASIMLTRFDVDFSDSAQVHHHKSSCTQDCICLPPVERLDHEYICHPAPATKPKQVPVFGPNYLMHYFRHPNCLSPSQRSIYRQLPKRVCGQLRASHEASMLGWGVHFEEGWHWLSLYFVVVVLLVIGSLIFGVAWAVLRADVQGAFAITSTWMTLGSLLFGYVAIKSY